MMTPQYILTKSLCRPAHCYSSHVPGQGYVGKDGPEHDAQRLRSAQSEIENMDWAPGYAEPGYTDPDKAILFANWNIFPTAATDLLERAGYAIEWSDEWSTCGDCGNAVRTSPDSYGWLPSYHIFNDCELVCVDCILKDPSGYLESLEDNPRSAITLPIDPTDHGYTLVEDNFESGFHPGQNDDPSKIYDRLSSLGHSRLVFKIDDKGQFDMEFSVYERTED